MMSIKSFVFLLIFFLFNGIFSIYASDPGPSDDGGLPAKISLYLYPRTVDDVVGFNFEPLGASTSNPVELIYWTVGFKRTTDGTVEAYPKSHNPDQTGDPTNEIVREMFRKFPVEMGYHHTWLLDTCLRKHAGLVDEGTKRLLTSFNEGQRERVVGDIVEIFRTLVREEEHIKPHSVSINIEPICQSDGTDSLLRFHTDLVTEISSGLGGIPVSVHMSCSKIHDWLTDVSGRTAGSPAERAYDEFRGLESAIRGHTQSYLIIDAYCHGNSCEDQSESACLSCVSNHFTSCRKLQAIFATFTRMEIPFKTALAISGYSSGGITPSGWSIENFRQSLLRIKTEGIGIELTSPHLRGLALYGVGGEGITGDLSSILDALRCEEFMR